MPGLALDQGEGRAAEDDTGQGHLQGGIQDQEAVQQEDIKSLVQNLTWSVEAATGHGQGHPADLEDGIGQGQPAEPEVAILDLDQEADHIAGTENHIQDQGRAQGLAQGHFQSHLIQGHLVQGRKVVFFFHSLGFEFKVNTIYLG